VDCKLVVAELERLMLILIDDLHHLTVNAILWAGATWDAAGRQCKTKPGGACH
jgi:hypothetical protein